MNKSERIHERICVAMSYEYRRKGEIVFNVDEKSNKFFIILAGCVNILIPKSQAKILKEKAEASKTKKTFFRLQKQKVDSESNISTNNDHDEAVEEEYFNEKTSVKSRFENILIKYHELLGGLGLNDIKASDMENLFDEGVLKFDYFGSLRDGQTFGELGILTGKLRSATIICKEECHFTYLNEVEYKNIVSVIERKKIFNKFEFFKNFLMNNVSIDITRKLSYSFEKLKFKRNKYVFKEGEECKYVYLLKKGEIQIQKFVSNYEKQKKSLQKLPFLAYFTKKKKIVIFPFLIMFFYFFVQFHVFSYFHF